ncbi:recombinase [Escherichia coli]|nr:recombinase [Escherichia coli]
MIWQPEFTDKTLSRKPGAVQLIALDKTWDDDLLPLCSQIFRRDIRASSELTQAEAVKALGFLKQKASEQKVAA